MISRAKIIELTRNKVNKIKKIRLPNSKNFSQPTYYDIKSLDIQYQNKLKSMVMNHSPFSEIVYGQKNILQETYQCMEKVNANQQNVREKRYLDQPDIDYEAFIQFNENETVKLPSLLATIFGNTLDINKCYLYGHKNPDSFYKSILHLKNPEFMIKNKNEANQSIFEIKKEVSFNLKHYWKTYKYNAISFDRSITQDKTISNLLNKESYVDSCIIQAFCNHIQNNIMIFNIIDKKFNIYYHKWDTCNYLDSSYQSYLLIDYKGCYLPCLYIDNKHLFTISHIDTIINEYEWNNKSMYSNYNYNYKINTLNTINTDNTITNTDNTITNTDNTITNTDNTITNTSSYKHLYNNNSLNDNSLNDNSLNDNSLNNSGIVNNDIKSGDELQLLAIKEYKLVDLQDLATKYNILIKKDGCQGKFKNKTKQELYDELHQKLSP